MPIQGKDFNDSSKLGFARRVIGNKFVDKYIRKYNKAKREGEPTNKITMDFNKAYDRAIAAFYDRQARK